METSSDHSPLLSAHDTLNCFLVIQLQLHLCCHSLARSLVSELAGFSFEIHIIWAFVTDDLTGAGGKRLVEDTGLTEIG